MPTSQELQKIFKLPMVPVMNPGEELLRQKYNKILPSDNKPGALEPKKTLAIPVTPGSDVEKLLSGGVSKSIYGINKGLPGKPGSLTETMTGAAGGVTIAAGLPPDLDKRVLRFFAYIREKVMDSMTEKERIRKFTLQYFLEDGTMNITEPAINNSGIPQGQFTKRHLIPTPDGTKSITFDMLNVGECITIYGRQYYIVDCDEFTRQFLNTIGVEPSPAYSYPDDAFTTIQSRPRKMNNFPLIADALSTTKLTREEVKAAMQFYEHDGNVLHMRAYWDDSKKLYGKRNFFHIYYFLADNTFCATEILEDNCGKDPFCTYIRQQKMPIPRPEAKKFENLDISLSFKGRDLTHPIYTDADIRIGATLNFFGRNFVITDYDAHTRDHLREKYGVTEYKPMKEDLAPPAQKSIVKEIPPYNGWGTEEDSLSCDNKLEPKPIRPDYKAYERFGNASIKFSLKLDDNQAVNEIRRFVLTCYLADENIAIFEPVQRNSGITGGLFLRKQRIKNPVTGKYFVAPDFHLGGRTVINGYPFIVLATDERSMSYMEQNGSFFPQCNVSRIAHKIQAMLLSEKTGLAEALHQADDNGKGSLDYHEFSEIVQKLNLDITEQEILTILRFYDRNGDGYITYDEFICRIMPEGAKLSSDERSWGQIRDDMVEKEHDKFSTKDKVDLQKMRVDTTTTAYAARAFEELYHQRRTLFLQEFKFICDYSTDGLISEREFKMCCTKKLKLSLSTPQLDALASKLFPERRRRVTYEEFVRLLNNNSNGTNNLKDLWEKHLQV